MTVLTVLVGIPASGKSAVARELIEATNSIWIQGDRSHHATSGEQDVRTNSGDLVFRKLQDQLRTAMQSGRNIVLDAKLRTPTYRKPYLELARKHGYATEAIFLNDPLETALANNEKLREQGELSLSEEQLRRAERLLQIPTYAEGFDKIKVRTKEPIDEEAAAFFHAHKARLIKEPCKLIRELEADGRLEKWLPELHNAIPVDQHNPHHHFTVYEHIIKASETVAGSSLKMVWTMLLHDIGKAYPGIKQFLGVVTTPFGRWQAKDRVLIDNGADIREGRDLGDFYSVQGEKIPKAHIKTDLNGHFYDHENLGAQLSYRILTRFGYSHDFALNVATLIQFHMLMPRDIVTVELAQLRKFYAKTGPYAADLMLVRLADTRGK
ncbi:AAA family ATPase [Tumebacillus algifaecis]|nr:AAA family ATPase [Tumebacillus algifaecis]